MRILSFKADGRILPYTLRDAQDTLKRLGHQVDCLDLRNTPPHVRMVLLADTLAVRRPDLIFTIDHTGMLPAVINALIQPPPVISWFYDNPLNILRPVDQLLRDRLHLFLWDRAYIEPVRSLGFPHVNYQPYGAPVTFFREHRHIGSPLYEVSFVGGHSPRREHLLRTVADQGISVHVFGNECWRSVMHPRLIYGGYASNREDCPRIYGASKINLNITSEQLLTALPVRVFDVLACGGFLLTDERNDAHTLFTPDRELVLYRDADHLVALLHHYLAHEKERRAVAEAGCRRVERDYSMDHLLTGMLEQPGIVRGNPQHPPSAPDYTLSGWIAGWIATMSCLKCNDLEQARQLIERLTVYAPDHEMTRMVTGLLHAKTGNAAALEELLHAVDTDHPFWKSTGPSLQRVLHEHAQPDWNFLYERFFAGTRAHP